MGLSTEQKVDSKSRPHDPPERLDVRHHIWVVGVVELTHPCGPMVGEFFLVNQPFIDFGDVIAVVLQTLLRDSHLLGHLCDGSQFCSPCDFYVCHNKVDFIYLKSIKNRLSMSLSR